MRTIKKFADEINNLFDQSSIKKLTTESGFIKRCRKLAIIPLLESVLFSNKNPSKISLNDMAIYLRIHHGIDISRQAIAKRFTKSAIAFLILFYEHLLNVHLLEDKNFFTKTCFNRIIIKDSTSNQLPENLKEHYPGSGGSGSSSAVKIHFEYDLTNSEILEFSVTPFNKPDKTNAKETLDKIQKNDLVIRDLGYVSVEILKAISERQAWYICKLNPSTSVKDKQTGLEIDFVEIQNYMKKNGILMMEIDVLVGVGEYPSRLIIELVPEKIKEQRLRKSKAYCQKKGKKLSNQKKVRFGLNLFLTNCSSKMISASEIRRLYGIRWQIELIFKAWKQTSQFHLVKKMNVNRYEFFLYAKLIMIMLNWKTYQMLDVIVYTDIRQRISVIKFYKTLEQVEEMIKKIIRGVRLQLMELIEHLKEVTNNLLHEDRKDRINWRNVENL